MQSELGPRFRGDERRKGGQLAVLAALLLAGCGASAQTGAPDRDIVVHGEPVPLDAKNPSRTQVGALTYAGGLVLTTKDSPAFGGFSGLDVRDDGSFISQSDVGWLMRGRIVTDAAGRLQGVERTHLSHLLDPDGRPFSRKALADAEDVTFLSDPAKPDAFAISFEGDVGLRRSRVSIYDSPDAPEHVVFRATEADTVYKLGPNYSFEAVTQCPGEGTFLLGSEDGQIARMDAKTGTVEQRNLVAPPPQDFRLTGLDCMTGGRVFALYRSFDIFSKWRTMIALLTWKPTRDGFVLQRHELARLDGSLTRDNMEGIAALDRPGGGVRLYLISDDNFDTLPKIVFGHQHTLLMAFDWAPPAH